MQGAEGSIGPANVTAEVRFLQGYAASIRANNATYAGDIAACVAYGEQVLALLPANPFPQAPRYVRASLYAYQFTDIPTRAATGAWWQRRRIGLYIAPMSLNSP